MLDLTTKQTRHSSQILVAEKNIFTRYIIRSASAKCYDISGFIAVYFSAKRN